jgi:hypothetical protein
MAMEQQPKIILIFSLKSSVSLFPTKAPINPPITIDKEFTITPRGIYFFLLGIVMENNRNNEPGWMTGIHPGFCTIMSGT